MYFVSRIIIEGLQCGNNILEMSFNFCGVDRECFASYGRNILYMSLTDQFDEFNEFVVFELHTSEF